MADVFEGKPDGRQDADRGMPVSRFRPRYRALSDEEKDLHDEIKERAAQLEALLGRIPKGSVSGRYHALAMTSLEEAIMWGVKALTS